MNKVSYSELINYKNSTNIGIQYLEKENSYTLFIVNGSFIISCLIFKTSSESSDFENNYKSLSNQSTLTNQIPFASKILKDGKKLFSRTHGKEFSLVVGNNNLTFEVPYPEVKINEIEILGCELGDSVDFFVLDSTTGTYTTIANYPLNQFGFDVKCPKDFYRRKSNYDADLFQGMQLYLVYNSKSVKDIYINYILHEVKNS